MLTKEDGVNNDIDNESSTSNRIKGCGDNEMDYR